MHFAIIGTTFRKELKTMEKKELFKQAYNDYLSICFAVNGQDFEESKKILWEMYNEQAINEDDEMYDCNFGACCFTIKNENGKAFICDNSIEVYDDCDCLGNYTAKEIAELGEIDCKLTNIKKDELQSELNKLLVGKSAYDIYKLASIVAEHFADLGIDNTQGEFATRIDTYTISITYKRKRLVSFDIKRKHDNTYGWLVRQVIVDDDFVDYKTSMRAIKERFMKEIANFDEYGFYSFSLSDLHRLLQSIKLCFGGKPKDKLYDLIRQLERDYWLVDELLESEK